MSSTPPWLAGSDRFNAFMLGAHALTHLIAPFLLRLSVQGLERGLPRSGPLIVAANHASALDPVLLTGYLAPAIGRPIHWMAKQELAHDPLLGPILRGYGGFTVRRGALDTEAFRTAKAVLDAGRVLAVFPEGTRSRDGSLQPAKPGVALLALRSGAPILPVGIGGLDRFLPRHTKIPRPFKRVGLRFGEPFTVEVPGGRERHEALEAATTELMIRIGRLLPERQWGHYGDAIRGSLTADPGGPPAA